MSKAELLANLCPRSPDLRMLPAGFVRLTESDIAHALARIPVLAARLLARAKYADDMAAQHGLHALLVDVAHAISHKERWKNVAPIPKLCELAVTQYIHPKRCRQCQGIGERLWGGRKIVCDRCGGSTWERTHINDIAKHLNISRENYTRTWAPRLNRLMMIQSEWDGQALTFFNQALANYHSNA